MTLWRRIERIEAEAQRQAEADTRPTELIVKLGDGRIERYDLSFGPGHGQRLDAGDEKEDTSNGQLESTD